MSAWGDRAKICGRIRPHNAAIGSRIRPRTTKSGSPSHHRKRANNAETPPAQIRHLCGANSDRIIERSPFGHRARFPDPLKNRHSKEGPKRCPPPASTQIQRDQRTWPHMPRNHTYFKRYLLSSASRWHLPDPCWTALPSCCVAALQTPHTEPSVPSSAMM